ncbi:hypothetical protein BD289DRAFT_358291 [Coniella lustricola]|uniref:DNA repair protein Rad26 n=1 Tax=Coniella lustricola TaxID=2025994 RepID=A0A2T3ANQ7_9PEZI|nr:hypothetical protein BD289DRAFT_358291 [Coniella lustricola]
MEDFSDDGFDELNDTVLLELENNAIRFTQANNLSLSPNPRANEYDLEDDDLDDAVVIDERTHAPPVAPPVDLQLPAAGPPAPQDPRQFQHRSLQQPRWQQHSTKPSTQSNPTNLAGLSSSRYAQPRPSVSQRLGLPTGPSSGRFGGPQQAISSQYPQPPSAGPLSSARGGYQQAQATQAQPQDNVVEALQARVQALENDLNSARGEVSIVRSKFERASSSHQAEVSKLKKQNAEALAKQQRLVEAAIHNEKAAATELQFTRQDLRDELQRSKKQRTDSVQSGGTTTPKRTRSKARGHVADGFDDVEILPSPSKAQGAAKGKGKATSLAVGERTPSRSKRKRPVQDSPVTALEVEDDVVMVDAASPIAKPHPEPTPGPSNMQPSPLPYDLLRLVLDHGAIYGQPLTFELLAGYRFPSDPDQSFASIIFQKLPSLGDPRDPLRLLVDFCDMIILIWDQCLREQYYEPIFDLVSLITFILQLNTISVAPYIATTLIPVAQTTIYLLGVPRYESENGDLSRTADEKTQHLILNIDTAGTLQLMYLAALGCTDSYLLHPNHPLDIGPDRDPPQKLYWKLMQANFVMMMLSPKQPHDEFLVMLRLLCTSCLVDSIGPITGEVERDPELVAQALIERVSKIIHTPHLWVAPSDSSGGGSGSAGAPYGYRQCLVRLAALRTLMAFAQSSLGVKQLALSDVAIPRLVNVLCGAIDALYDMDVPVELFQPQVDKEKEAEGEQITENAQAEAANPHTTTTATPSNNTTSEDAKVLDSSPTPLLYTLISSIILLLHTLITDPATSAHVDMRVKLSTSHGASQKYLLTLSRLNYAEENLVLEAGIDPATFDMANDMLDLTITPEEAEGVRAVFG